MPDKIKLLIVDDERLIRVGQKALFEDFPIIEVLGEAENGEQAIKLAGELKPDVILMDIMMEYMDGIEVTRRIKESYPEIKIIMFTCIPLEQQLMDSLAAGANAYVIKDIETAMLVIIIQSVKEGGFWLDPRVSKFLTQKKAIFDQNK